MSVRANQNHPFVFWGTCLLWFLSLISILWSLVLFFSQNIGDMLVIIETDIVNAFVLLAGLIMLPKNCYMMHSIAEGIKINRRMKVLCCPLWMCMLWIILINVAGAILSIQRMSCSHNVTNILKKSLQNYSVMPAYRHFIDNIQWTLQCCGLSSYQDWFALEWTEKMRDTEWQPQVYQRSPGKMDKSDSVPLSCCKSGYCISNYLTELGTSSINTNGCCDIVDCIVKYSMLAHLVFFGSIAIVEVLMFKYIPADCQPCPSTSCKKCEGKRNAQAVHIMAINENFDGSSCSYQVDIDDSKGNLSVARQKTDTNYID